MSDTKVLFRNRMGLANWTMIALGFALAGALLVLQGTDLLLAVLICGGLALVAILVVIVVIVAMGRSHVGELVRRGPVLEAEMLSPAGRGRVVAMPLADVRDWRVTRLWPSVRFRHEGREFVLPLSGARVDWPALRQAAAPGPGEVVR